MSPKYINLSVILIWSIFAITESEALDFLSSLPSLPIPPVHINPLLPTLLSSLPIGSSSSEFVSNGIVTGPSATQSASNGLGAVSSTSQSSSNAFGTGFSISQSSLAVADYPQPLPVVPVDTDPVISLLSKYVVQAFVSSEYLKNFMGFGSSKLSDFFYKVSYDILLKGGFNVPSLAELIAQSVKSVDVLTSPKYFDAAGNILGKFLRSKGRLTLDNALVFAQGYLSVVEDIAISRGVSGTESLIYAIANGLFDYLNILGFNDFDSYTQMFYLFANELSPNTFVAEAEASAGISVTT